MKKFLIGLVITLSVLSYSYGQKKISEEHVMSGEILEDQENVRKELECEMEAKV